MLAAVLVATGFHLPSLDTGFVSDDAFHSLTAGVVAMRGVSAVHIVGEDIAYYVTQGRLHAVGATTLLNYALFPSLVAYKLSKLAALMGVFALWGVFLRRLTGCRATALLGVLLAGVLLQYRLYHDPVVSFGWEMPQTMALFLGSLLLLLEAEKRHPRRLSIASAVLFLASVMALEIMLPLVLVHVALAAWGRPRREAAALVAPHLIVAVGFVALLAGLRLYYEPPVTNFTEVRIEPLAMLGLLFRQAWGALPLSYGLTEGSLLTRDVLVPGAAASLLAAFAFGVALRARTVQDTPTPGGARRLVAVALLLWLLSALMITPSAKYQREVVLGLAYLPVFVAVFGVAALLARAMVGGLRRIHHPAAQVGLLAALVPLVTLGYGHNVAIAQVLAEQWRYPREALTDALDAGILDAESLRGGAWVQSWSETPPWHRRELFALHGGAVPDAMWSGELPAEELQAEPPRLRRPLAYLTYGAPSGELGLAVGGVAERVDGEPPRPFARRARVFVRRPRVPGELGSFNYFSPVPHGARIDVEEIDADGARTAWAEWIERGVESDHLRLRRTTARGELWEITASDGRLIGLSSIRVSTLPN